MYKRFGRNLALLGLLIAVVAMAGCSCKEYEEQIMQLDAQIAEMQKELSDKTADADAKNQQQSQPPPNGRKTMSTDEAMEVLGLKPGYSPEDVKQIKLHLPVSFTNSANSLIASIFFKLALFKSYAIRRKVNLLSFKTISVISLPNKVEIVKS